MSTPAPASVPSASARRRRALLWVLGAAAAGLAIGLLLFLLVWGRGRDGDGFFRADGVPPVAGDETYAPLPVPEPGDGTASGMANDPVPPKRIARPRPAPTAPAQAGDVPPDAATRPNTRALPPSVPQPLADSSPAPEYPARALRRNESGTVLLSIEVDPAGQPQDVSVARSSGSRDLDRAAVQAVRRWRFRPATADGQPVAGTVRVPIDFQAPR